MEACAAKQDWTATVQVLVPEPCAGACAIPYAGRCVRLHDGRSTGYARLQRQHRAGKLWRPVLVKWSLGTDSRAAAVAVLQIQLCM